MQSELLHSKQVVLKQKLNEIHETYDQLLIWWAQIVSVTSAEQYHLEANLLKIKALRRKPRLSLSKHGLICMIIKIILISFKHYKILLHNYINNLKLGVKENIQRK